MTSQNLTHVNGKNEVVQSDFECNDPGNAFITIFDTICGKAQESFFKPL